MQDVVRVYVGTDRSPHTRAPRPASASPCRFEAVNLAEAWRRGETKGLASTLAVEIDRPGRQPFQFRSRSRRRALQRSFSG